MINVAICINGRINLINTSNITDSTNKRSQVLPYKKDKLKKKDQSFHEVLMTALQQRQ